MIGILILIVIIIVLASKNDNLTKENLRLQGLLANKIKFCPSCGANLNEALQVGSVSNENQVVNTNDNIVVPLDYNPSEVVQPVYKPVKQPYDSQKVKNSMILIVGSILIVLAAVIFLTSTWEVTNNYFKTFIIMLMLVVFLAASYISENVFKLDKTSKAFLYISLAYIPILSLSISLFGLFGDYLSLFGQGKYIYLTISSFVVALIYFISAIKKQNTVISIFSVVFQIFGFIFLPLIFCENYFAVLVSILLYNLFINGTYIFKMYYYKDNVHLGLINVLTPLFSVYSFISLFFKLFDGLDGVTLVVMLLMIACIYIWVVRVNNSKKTYSFIYPMLTIFASYNFIYWITDIILVRELFILISILGIYVFEYIRNNELSIGAYIETLISVVFLYISVCGNGELDPSLVMVSMLVLNVVNYVITEKYKLFQGIVLVNLGLISLTHLVDGFSATRSLLLMGYATVFVNALPLIFKKLDIQLKQSMYWVSNLWIWAFSFGFVWLNTPLELAIIYLIYVVVNYLYFVFTKHEVSKIIGYVFTHVLIGYVCSCLKVDEIYIIPMATIAIVLLEWIVKKIRSDSSNILIIIQFVLSYLALMGDLELEGFVLAAIITFVFGVYVTYYKQNINFFYIPALAMIPHIYGSTFLIINEVNFMYFISIILLFSIGYMIFVKKNNMFIVLMYIYWICHASMLEEEKYVSIMLLIMGTFITYIIKENKVKEWFKALLYFTIFILYHNIINDININDIAVFNIGSYVLLLLLYTRSIIRKYNKDTGKVLEYIGLIIINLLAFPAYTNEFDGLIYVLFLVLLVILSYVYKWGPVLVISLFFILFNLFMLTRAFWFSIPWWIYILLTGSILIGFAIYNETKEKKDNDLKEKVELIKKSLDL